MNIVKKLLKEREIREKYFKNYLKYAFGSIVNGNYYIMLSDIDIAIILKEEIFNREKTKFEVSIDNEFSDNPFEIHIVTKDLWENWYKRFVKIFIEI